MKKKADRLKREDNVFGRKCICRRHRINPKCVKCYLKKVFEPKFEATCVEQPEDGVELAGARFKA